jgi:hypothetical protein
MIFNPVKGDKAKTPIPMKKDLKNQFAKLANLLE